MYYPKASYYSNKVNIANNTNRNIYYLYMNWNDNENKCKNVLWGQHTSSNCWFGSDGKNYNGDTKGIMIPSGQSITMPLFVNNFS